MDEPLEAPAAPLPPQKPKARRGLIDWLVYAFVVSVVVYVVLIVFFVDVVWPATVLAYLPRWPGLVPGVIVLGLSIFRRNKTLIAAAGLGTLALVVFVQDFQVPSLSCGGGKDEAKVRIVTQNSLRKPISSGWLAELVKRENLDLALVQECNPDDLGGKSPLEGYEMAVDYNTCLFSRFHIVSQDVRERKDVWEKGGSGALALYELEAPWGHFYVLNLHLETVRAGISGFRQFGLGGVSTMHENIELRSWESKLASEWAARAKGPLIIGGDFNMPRESRIFQNAWPSFGNAFDTCGWGYGYSKETVVRHMEFGTRIDHVLFDDHWKCRSAHLADRIGSDHRGMVAELHLK